MERFFTGIAYMERKRLEEVKKFLQLDFDKSQEFKDITDLASQLCGAPISLITLLDKDINWIKVSSGIDLKSAPRETSFCQYGIRQDELLIIKDTTKDKRFDDNPLVYDNPGVRFYAGAPLILSNGYRLGTLCLFDLKPNDLTELQQKTLTVLSRQVTFLMELELSYKTLQEHTKAIEAQNKSLKKIAKIQSHDVRQPLTSIMGLVDIIKNRGYKADKSILVMIEEATQNLDKQIHAIVRETTVPEISI